MPGSTSPMAIPYPVAGDTLRDAVSTIPQQAAEKVDDLLAGLSGVAAVGWTELARNTGWGGSIVYSRKASMVTVTFEVTKASFGQNDFIGTLPAGFRPSVNIFTAGFFGTSLRPIWVHPDGRILMPSASTGGVSGSASFLV